MEIKGTIIKVLPIERGTSKSGKQWQKATIVVEYEHGEYPKALAAVNMKHAEEFAKLPMGAEVTLQVDVTSREFNGKWYTACDCWKWEITQAASVNDPYAALGMQPTQKAPESPKEDDGLPF